MLTPEELKQAIAKMYARARSNDEKAGVILLEIAVWGALHRTLGTTPMYIELHR